MGRQELQVAERAGVQIPSGCNSGSCGICEVAVYKYRAGQDASAEAVVRSCIARVPPGYTRIKVDLMDDPLWGSDGWDT
ncbi:hypothetical protein WJX81_003036 [Elliptochloris bilobata]|uniref:2Fe-2S ferredoxin-type domain-containing protein n=1 Tax=Elliptochloris bilobata TaxID=381761 RepID=A0AAW1QKL3_9CHLO